MKIAFASCLCSQAFPAQPVWGAIAAQKPDYLVLLGDSIYLDIDFGAVHPMDMDDNQFSQHLFKLYNELFKQPQFSALVKSLPAGRVFSVWDDHDFLWNDAPGAAIQNVHKEKIRLSTAFFEAFRKTLAAGLAPGSFPDKLGDDAFWKPRKPLSTPSIQLPENVWLHLGDVRTFRTVTDFQVPADERTILGDAQKKQIEAAVRAAPDAVHLLASASTMADWKHYAHDLDWILDLASTHRMMVLSGDVHYNDVDAFFTGGLPLHEATSSGAAVKDAVVQGKEQQNYGLLDVDAQHVNLRLFHFGTEELKYARRYSRQIWLPV